MKSSRVTLQDVADLAKVSRPSASLVLNGRGTIQPSTRQRVLEAAKQLGYRPNPIASGLRLSRTNMIGVLWVFAGPHASTQLVRHFNESALAQGYSALIHDTIGDAAVIVSQLEEMTRLRVDGLILQITAGQERNLPGFERLLKLVPQVVIVSDEPLEIDHPQIILSRHRAMADATRHLVACGRTSFGFLEREKTTGFSNQLKLNAVRSTLKELGVKDDVATFQADMTHAWKVDLEEIDRIFMRSPRTAGLDVLLATTDELAAAAITSLRRMGKRIPEEIAVVGFNDTPIASFFDPPIATVQRNEEAVAIRAIQRLIANIKNPEQATPEREEVEMNFVWRASAGGPPWKPDSLVP